MEKLGLAPAADWREEIRRGDRFGFGSNWAKFLDRVNEDRVRGAEASLREMLGVADLTGQRFLDAGSGSGLFSLAARRLGATVHSFDFDPYSVACTRELRRRHFGDDPRWSVEQGSVLDGAYLDALGTFDIVYSWGVLHHTGAMWQALAKVAELVASNGQLFIAIYNDQGRPSARWLRVKKAYNRLPSRLRWLVLAPSFVRLWGPATLRDVLKGKPLATWRNYARQGSRSMDPWRDVVDWVGGYPFEVAKPEQVFAFYRERGFTLEALVTLAGGLGCNEFVFRRTDAR